MTDILCADLGATKALLAVARVAANGQPTLLGQRRYAAADHASFEAVIAAYAQDWQKDQGQPLRVQAAAVGAAGPVEGEAGSEQVRMTNLDWLVRAAEVSAQLRELQATPKAVLPVRLVNDFVVAAHGVDALHPEDLLPLQAGQAQPRAPQLVIGAGSGLGVAWRIWQGDAPSGGYAVLPSESGHNSFAPCRAEFDALMPALRQRCGRVANEFVVSGRGLVTLYRVLCEQARPTTRFDGELDSISGEDIARLAFDEQEPLALRAVDLFLLAYGAVAGDLALSLLARGGVFVAGGVAAQWGKVMQDGRFMAGFTDKGPYAELTRQIPVQVITQGALPLLGAARLGWASLR